MRKIRLYGKTDATQAATITSDTVAGKLYAVVWLDGDLTDGVDATLSVTGSEGAVTLLTLTDANADAVYYPRHLAHTNAGVAISDITDTARGVYEKPLVFGRLQLAITAGGASKSGGCIVFIED